MKEKIKIQNGFIQIPLLIAIVVFVIGIVLLFVFQNREVAQPINSENPEVSSRDTTTQPLSQKGISSEELTTISFDVLQALSFYYFASVDNISGGDVVAIMTELMNDNKHLRSGNSFVEKYSNHSNKNINLTAQGMIIGSQEVIKANDNLLQFLRSLDQQNISMSEIDYKMATFLSSQKEGFGLITISAPQITALMFEPAKSDNPTGAIPYTISKEQRTRLLKEIERLFGDELKEEKNNAQRTGYHNAILVAVQAIQNNLLPDTYEDIRD